MAVWSDALWVVRLAGDRIARRRRVRPAPTTPQENRALATVMRALSGRYADRLPTRTMRRISDAAAAGQWERAVQTLIIALSARSAPLSASEHQELRTVAGALCLPARHVQALLPQEEVREAISGPVGTRT